MVKSKYVVVRMSESEVAKLDKLAHQTQRDRSKVLRMLLYQAVAKSAPDIELQGQEGTRP